MLKWQGKVVGSIYIALGARLAVQEQRAKLFALAMTGAVALLIAYGTLRPPGGGAPLPLTDKQLHFAAFAALALPLSWVRPRWVLWLVPLAIAYGAAIEVIQPSVGRSGEWADLIADALGVMTGAIPGLLRQRFRRIR